MADPALVLTITDCTCLHATDKALKVMIPGHGEEWVPKAAVHDESEVYDNGHSGDLILHKWFADGVNSWGTDE